jgi:two-component system chemotaxis response regulator CheY
MARILLVDDDYDIRELGRALLVHAGHDVSTADGAINALLILRESPFDMLITDVSMPNHSGFDLLKMIRLEGKWPHLMTVMLTGRREKRDVEAAAREGVDAYIVKPIDPELFVERIESLLAKDTEVSLPSVDFSIVAQVLMNVEIRSVSEVGIVIKSPYQFRSGTLLPLDSAIFRRIGIANPLTRVFVSQRRDGDYETRLTFVDLNDEDAARLRDWTERQQPSKKRAA